MYSENKVNGLDKFIFPIVVEASNLDEFDKIDIETETETKNDLKSNLIILTVVRQGTADWHKATRQFSFTSSQSDAAFRKVIQLYYQNDNHQYKASFITVATYLYGSENW